MSEFLAKSDEPIDEAIFFRPIKAKNYFSKYFNNLLREYATTDSEKQEILANYYENKFVLHEEANYRRVAQAFFNSVTTDELVDFGAPPVAQLAYTIDNKDSLYLVRVCLSGADAGLVNSLFELVKRREFFATEALFRAEVVEAYYAHNARFLVQAADPEGHAAEPNYDVAPFELFGERFQWTNEFNLIVTRGGLHDFETPQQVYALQQRLVTVAADVSRGIALGASLEHAWPVRDLEQFGSVEVTDSSL